MEFEVIPAVDIRGGKCVQLVQGVPGSEMISLDDPLVVALEWITLGAKTLHIVDLDGALDGKKINAPIIEKIVLKGKERGVLIQIGGGIRSFEDAANLLKLGADRVILSTAALREPELVRRLSNEFGSSHINVALDSKNGKVAIEGWKKVSEYTAIELGKKFEKLGAGTLLFTNIDTEGLMRGVNPEPTAELVKSVNIPVIASGGITTLEDIITIRATGACGVVVGSALYTGKFTYPEALNILKMQLK
ncbi:MAG: 1-(5-phosphoribosyl)-5-[(5-phosphoribosylamino)methylideneamino]imidazole-4-carboxamide isomerase [Methanomethylovorans sp.]|jgi:phosphoribosylformimino-5-aminoimidazole carboxamide ribotide isomerase|nr:1-(5-phosphoribosyl)-5-[(5-phosphoribosylamino)methylideneamino]imidazole-4-carboxamide isomerase [Methanomethylovorans sp.]